MYLLSWLQKLIKAKRSNMQQQQKSKGLGDTIQKFTTATGIKKVVDTVAKATGKDCGCNKRRDALNRAFPYQDKK
jgi:hypothetical protein